MAVLSIFEALLGALLIVFTLCDALLTILSLQGGGPATSFITQLLWRGLLKIHRGFSSHRLLALSGPALMVLIVVFWYVTLYLGWFLVFHAFRGVVFDSTSLASASDLQTLYFTGVTISGLGYGDFIAREFPWTLYSTLAVSTGTLLTSLGLSYIITVVPVALQKKQIAYQLNALVGDPDELIRQLDSEDNVAFIWNQLFSAQVDGANFSTKYGAYPVVAYFHSMQINSAFPVAYLKSSDILFYIANHPVKAFRPPSTAIKTLHNMTNLHTRNLQHVIGKCELDDDTQHSRFEYPIGLEEIQSDAFPWEDFLKLRRWLVAHCLYDGW